MGHPYPPVGPGGYGGYGYPPVDHPQGTTVLVLGILSLVMCGILGPFAWVMGNTALREIDAAPGRYANRSTVNAGRICGIISSLLLAIPLVLFLLFLLVFVVGGLALA